MSAALPQDPTELGTFVSAVNCEKCKYNYLLPVQVLHTHFYSQSEINTNEHLHQPNTPVQPLDHESKWSCQACDHTESNQQVGLTLIMALTATIPVGAGG